MPQVLKGPGCRGCPFEGAGRYMTPDEVRPVPVAVVGQNPGRTEEAEGRPFVGATGQAMEREYLPLAGLSREKVSICNAIRCRLNGSDELPPLDAIVTRQAIAHCARAYGSVPPEAELIVTQGAYALYAMTQEGIGPYRTVSSWRGALLPYEPVGTQAEPKTGIYVPEPGARSVFATIHLAALGREPQMRLPTRMDWRKVKRVLAGEWPVALPAIEPYGPQKLPARCAFDTEFTMDTGEFLRYSMYDGQVLRVVEKERVTEMEADPGSVVIMQNAPADLHFFEAMLRPGDFERCVIDDTSYIHSVLWSDFPHDLEFLGSLYSDLNRWKHLAKVNPTVYAAGDAYGTWDVAAGLEAELALDPQSRWVYEHCLRPQVHVIAAGQRAGLRVDRAKAAQFLTLLEAKCRDAELMGEAAAGWPINLHSNPMLCQHLYELEGLKARKARRW